MNSIDLPEACEGLRAGKLLLYPTETFFAIGGDALNPKVVRKVYTAKKRLSSFPLPVIIGETVQLKSIILNPGYVLNELIAAFWPGPLTVLCPVAPGVPGLLTCGSGKIAVRIPHHPAARELCLQFGGPIISSSANLSGNEASVTAEGVDKELLDHVAGIYDPPVSPDFLPKGGLPSTIVEPLDKNAMCLRLIRPGAVSRERLKAAGFTCVE